MKNRKWIGFQMKEALKLVEEIDVEDKVVPIRGGKEGPTDWLSTMVIGTTFIAGNYATVFEYTLLSKELSVPSTSLLRRNNRQGIKDTSEWFWCLNNDFCYKHKLIKVLHE